MLPVDRQLTENTDKLVAHTEQTLQAEYDGWAQQMQQTLTEMAKQHYSGRRKNIHRHNDCGFCQKDTGLFR